MLIVGKVFGLTMRRGILLVALAALLGGCALAPPVSAPLASAAAEERAAIAARLMRDIEVLASDEFEGRKPGTKGAALTIDYLAQRYAEIGLESGTNDPGNPWRAPVPLTSIRPDESKVELIVGGKAVTLRRDEAIAIATLRRTLIAEADMVFVGYEAERVPAPRIEGRIVVMLADASLNPERRILLEAKGALAVIVIAPDTAILEAVVQRARSETIALSGEVEEVFAVVATPAGMARALGQARWDALLTAAEREDFTAIDLSAKANIETRSQRRDFTSYNILGRIVARAPAGDGSEGGEGGQEGGAVLLLAHWDHLGECAPPAAPDLICNGAIDNASGVAVMLELARRLAAGGPFQRDIYVLATTAEEFGLLGARAFAANPPVPLGDIVAAFNFDTVAIAPAGAPLGFVGKGRTALDPLVIDTISEAGRSLGDAQFAELYLRRQDGWVLLQKGVPAVMLSSAFGSQATSGPYFDAHYHGPSDESAGIELGGAIDDLLLHEALVRRLALPVVPNAQGQ